MVRFSFAGEERLRRGVEDLRGLRTEAEEVAGLKAAQERKVAGLRADRLRVEQVRKAVLARAERPDELLHAERYLTSVTERLAREEGELWRISGLLQGRLGEAGRVWREVQRLAAEKRRAWDAWARVRAEEEAGLWKARPEAAV